ncbi:NAD(P)H-dependent glycerol-3-phosphate dehydrogenase [Lusitaniella coriacea LEGE 07157]|uniref:Glycerol-3-phosphate dehydrogenase [NAD(P)+] n=1 Tax=Lusitaniella coriacea LEGE 07157 TaxID=945747 RepID=A0A8J7DZV3_9CYAN|nr:NAD(P)H-dependent glycerol-3-phosphate dehydrogenase [Lusitaniella coriacea]MBE9117603.1 NAD(P)H-dependent glycerol-3-phosphate dehydrogenase [Lusitaniella coriacea LEGE 07157]
MTPTPSSQPSTTLTILGRGAWGTALANLARINNTPVQTWSYRSGDPLEPVVSNAKVILSAISMKGVAELATRLKTLPLESDVIFVTATKGLDPATKRTPSQIWQTTFPNHPVAVLSGPNLSKEIDLGLPAATVIASEDLAAAETVQELFSSDTFRVYTNTDPLGTELGGTLKNVMAIAVGVCDGLKLGTNARSALVTRALPEVMRIGTLLGGQAETFYGLSGLGDMLATCTSPLSRNYQVGYGLAQGKALDDILEELGSTAEGVNTTYVLIDRVYDEGISAPIAWQVYRLLKGKITPQEAVAALMERELKPEYCDLP